MLAFRATSSPEVDGANEGVAISVQCYLDLAHGMYQLGNQEEASRLLGRAAAIAQALGDRDPRRARVLTTLGVLQARQGKYREAERQFRQSIAILERACPSQNRELAIVLSNLGAVHRTMGRGTQARSVFDRALKLAEPKVGEPDLPMAWTLDQIGDLEAAEGNLVGAVYLLRRALAIKERMLGAANPDVAVTLGSLGDLYYRQARYNEAETLLLRVVAIREKLLGWDDPRMAKPLLRLAQVYVKQRKTGRAEQLVRYALKLFALVLPPTHSEITGCLKLLSEIYQELSRFADADAASKLARGLLDGTEDAAKLRRFAFSAPPRISAPGERLLEPGLAG